MLDRVGSRCDIINGVKHLRQLVRAQLPQHLLLLLHVLSVLAQRVLLLQLLLSQQLLCDVARARLQSAQGFLMHHLDG